MEDISKYEKISDDIMVLANKVVLRMNVGLSVYSNNRRIVYHKEIEYHSQKANSNVINIKRNFDYYLTIENIKSKAYIRIGISDMIKLRYALNEAYKFFIDPRFNNLYAKKDGEIIIYNRVDPIIITDLTMGKYLQFEPVVFTNFRGEGERGLRIYLSSDDEYFDMPINRLEAFKYITDTINLYESAQLMINYIQRPELGTNLFSYNTEEELEDYENKFEKRDVSSRKLSYFDRMKGLEE